MISIHRFIAIGAVCAVAQTMSGMPAFPGAEGAGAEALGGRGGDVYYVTNLADSGAGTLRQGISSATGPRTILFKVSGNILLGTDLKINKPYLTIAGQTAPGDGITLQGRLTTVENCHDVVVRFIRARPGDIDCPSFQDDSFHFMRATNCIADHVSASWSIDEVLSCTHYSTNVTVQWCFITESLNNSCHVKGAHGYGSLLRYGEGAITYHHNLYADHNSRNPRLGDNLKLDFVNNVIYNWGGTAGYNADDTADNPAGFTNILNYVGNYLIAGPSTSGHLSTAFDSGVLNANSFEIYQSGNFIDNNKNGAVDGANTGWGMFSTPYVQRVSRYPIPSVTTDSAQVAYEQVLAFGGASSARDAVDSRIVSNVVTQTGAIIDSQSTVGGYPVLNSTTPPDDTDNDGIPDYWESAVGWDPGVPNNNHVNADGYTDLEHYLDWSAKAHGVCEGNSQVDLDLRQLTGGLANLTFGVSNGTNGTVALLPDGHTARFTASANYSGLANFTFTANDTVNATGFGPVSVGILVKTNEVIYVPPTVSISNPTDGATLEADAGITLSAAVTNGDGTVTNVQFYAGQSDPLTLVGEDTTEPYEQPWTVPSISGFYTIRVVAMDDNGLSGSDSIVVTVNGGIQKLSTFVGGGADMEFRERLDSGSVFSQSTGNGPSESTRTSPAGDRNEIVGLKFDLSGYTLSELTNVTLNLYAYRMDGSTRVVDLYGVAQGTVSGTGNFDTETWNESATLFGDLPGLLDTDEDPSTQSLNVGALTPLGSYTVASGQPEGTIHTFSSPAITTFLQAYQGSHYVTLLMAAGNTSTGQFLTATRQATSTATGVLTGAEGDLAPYLEFEVVPSVVQPTLEHEVTGGGTSIQFGWMGSFKLQYQTNSLGIGLGTNWMDYPDTNNPVVVPIDPLQPAAWFRLSE